MLQGTPEAQRRARELRKAMSLPERLLWQRLRHHPGGLKFRPQHPASDWVLDFYCHRARLIVEVDGISHDLGDRPERDEIRDSWFTDKGFEVVRIAAKEVLRDPDEAAAAIVALAGSRLPGKEN